MASNYKVNIKKDNETTSITFSGQLTISNIEKIVSETKEEILSAEVIHIIIKDVENLDLTFVQYVCSIKQTAKKAKRTFNMESELPDELSLLVKNAGFKDIFEFKTN